MNVKGFTLPEMLFVLILTGLVVGFCGYSYVIIKQHELRFHSQNKEITNTVLTVTRITSMAYQSDFIYINGSTIIFDNNGVIGQLSIAKDSLILESREGFMLSKIACFSLELDTVQLKNDVCIVKSFSFVPEGLKFPLIFQKQYKGSILFNNSIDWKQ